MARSSNDVHWAEATEIGFAVHRDPVSQSSSQPLLLKKGDHCSINYTGRLRSSGAVFDSSRTPGRKAINFTVGDREVILGLEEALLELGLGDRYATPRLLGQPCKQLVLLELAPTVVPRTEASNKPAWR